MAKQYPNRSDLRGGKLPKTAAQGQAYGQAGAQMASQAAVPMAPSPTDTPSPRVQPGQMGSLLRPTERPNEPVTAGASFGPGPTPQTQYAPPTTDAVLMELRSLYNSYPSEELADMLDSYVREGF